MESFGLVIDDYQAEFNKIDTNGGGMILFDEFAAYCIKKTLTAEEDCEWSINNNTSIFQII